jgi:hypothetical protein
MDSTVTSALIAGGFSAAAGVLAYVTSKRTLRQQLLNDLTVNRAEADRSYQLAAMKSLREAVGAPKSQIIESLHDLSDRLRGFLSESPQHPWSQTGTDGTYRRTFTWRLVRPLVWIAILRQRMVYLDQTLGGLISEELTFLRDCYRFERAFYGGRLFVGTKQSDSRLLRAAAVPRESLAEIADRLTVKENATSICATYSDFCVEEVRSVAGDVEALVIDLDEPGRRTQFRLARLIAIYCTANALLDEFSLPYRTWESREDSYGYLRLLDPELREAVRPNLERMFEDQHVEVH